MLGSALVGLQSRKAQMRAFADRLCEFHRGLARLDSATVRADVDLHEHVERHPELSRSRIERSHVGRIIRANGDTGLGRERGESLCLECPDELVRDENVPHAAFDHRFGLAHLLATHAYRAERDLAQRDLRALVTLRVRAHGDLVAAQRFAQAFQIAVERIELEDQGRRVDFRERHPDGSRRKSGHGEPPFQERGEASVLWYRMRLASQTPEGGPSCSHTYRKCV